MGMLDVDGDRLHFLEAGQGPPCLLVHGSCGGARQWKGLMGLLASDYSLYAVDLFGAGESEPWPMEREWTRADDERALNALLDQIGRPVHLIMHSAGGQFAWALIARRPGDFLSLTFYEPVLFQLLRETGDPLFEEPASMAKRYREEMDRGNWEGAMRGFVDHWVHAGAWDDMPEDVRALMTRGAGRLYHEWLMPHWDWPLADDLRQVALPVLLLKGTETLAAMHGLCEIAAETFPDCRFETIEGAGHMGPFTHADRVYRHLQPHLAAHTP